MKTIILLIILSVICCFGCSDTARLESLEKEVSALKAKKAKDTMLLAEEAGARKFWWRNARIGGGDALDGISAANLSDGDSAFVIMSGTTEILPYIFRSGITEVEDGFLYINDDTGNGTWFLCTVGTSGVSGYGVDGYNRLNVTNSNGFSGTAAAGDCYYDLTSTSWCCYDGADWNCCCEAVQ